MWSPITEDDSVLPAPSMALPVSSNWTSGWIEKYWVRRRRRMRTSFWEVWLKGKRCEMGARIRGHRRKSAYGKRKGSQRLDRNRDGKKANSYQEYSRQKTEAEWMKWSEGQSAGRPEGQEKLRDKARRRVKGKGHWESNKAGFAWAALACIAHVRTS